MINKRIAAHLDFIKHAEVIIGDGKEVEYVLAIRNSVKGVGHKFQISAWIRLSNPFIRCYAGVAQTTANQHDYPNTTLLNIIPEYRTMV